MSRQRFTVKKHNGDGFYDYALFDNGRPVASGMARFEANAMRDVRRAKEQSK